jgi:RNA polymerase sigma-70 factor (ECF subfamily)
MQPRPVTREPVRVERASDEELMGRVRAGDVGRLADLFDRHAGRLRQFFLRRGGDRDLSDDLVQETFLRVLRYRSSWRGEGSFAGWLYRLACNVEHDERARGGARDLAAAAAAAADGAAAADSAGAAAPPEAIARRESVARLYAALARLEPQERALVEFRWFQGLRAEQIAERLGCTPGAARVRLHRAHLRLRELQHDEE